MLCCISLSDLVLITNGLYDLACGFAILLAATAAYRLDFFSDVHLSVFSSKEHRDHPTVQRILSYWILTYGAVRLAAGIHRDQRALRLAAALTYFIEAACYHFESIVGGTMVRSRAAFVSILSVILGILVLADAQNGATPGSNAWPLP